MEIHAVDILYDFCIISVLLLIAKIIRVKIKLVQKLYIPTSLIAGFLGLFCGKYFLNVLPFSQEISNYASILITVLFASLFLGNKKKTSFKAMINSVGDTFLVNAASEMMQFGVFILIGFLILPLFFKGIHRGFGLMLPAGFVGGHGTAVAIGGVFAEAGWEDAISIGQTFATVGLLGGIIGGVILINIGARKGYTRMIKEIAHLPEEMHTGLVPETKREIVGENTINSMSLDSLTWHLMLILIAVGAAYLINAGLKFLFPAMSFPTYGLALICSIVLQGVLKLFKLDLYVDKKIITHMGSSATDYLVAFGVASINISVVIQYWIPIVVLIVLGFLWVIAWNLIISKKFFHNYWFERGLYIFGMSTGVLATGVILLRICDPEFKSGVLEDFGFAWIFLSIMDMILVSFAPICVLNGWGGYIFAIIIIILAVSCLTLSAKMFGLQNDDGTVLRKGEI